MIDLPFCLPLPSQQHAREDLNIVTNLPSTYNHYKHNGSPISTTSSCYLLPPNNTKIKQSPFNWKHLAFGTMFQAWFLPKRGTPFPSILTPQRSHIHIYKSIPLLCTTASAAKDSCQYRNTSQASRKKAPVGKCLFLPIRSYPPTNLLGRVCACSHL